MLPIMNTQLLTVAHARSGDKGNRVNIGLIARGPEVYPLLREQVTAEVVEEYFGSICLGKVERYEMPNISALNFVLHDALDGGGTVSLKLDAQGKSYGAHLLRLSVEIPEQLVHKIHRPTESSD